MYNPNDDPDGEVPRGVVERRRQPFVPDPHRVSYPAYPVDYGTRQQLAVQEYVAQTRIEVGGQITREIIGQIGQMEREIREQAEDGPHYMLMARILASFAGDAEQIRHDYMNPDDRPRYRR